MGSFFKRYRELLVTGVLLALPLVVYASHAGLPEVPGPVRRGVVEVTSPVEWAVVGAVHLAQDLWFGYLDLRQVRQENLKLEEENLRLKADRTRLAEALQQNERLKRMVAYSQAQPDFRMVAAPVLGFGPDPQSRVVRIGCGLAQGVRVGMPAVTPDGVVGRVIGVLAGTADVLLVTDPDSAVPALCERTRSRATARGVGFSDHLKLAYVLKSDDVKDGDVFVTAPSGGLFPKGLPIGTAASVREAPGSLFKEAKLVPFVDFRRLEEVQVIVDSGVTAEADGSRTARVQ